MKVFYTTSFIGHWPVGGARFLCVAPDLTAAQNMLYSEMMNSGLMEQFDSAVEGLEEISTDSARVVTFGDGEY